MAQKDLERTNAYWPLKIHWLPYFEGYLEHCQNVEFQKISILPPWKVPSPPPPQEISVASYFASKILTFNTLTP